MEDFKLVIEELEKRKRDPLKKLEDRVLGEMITLLRAMDLKKISPAGFNDEMKQIKTALGAQLDTKVLSKANGAIKGKLRHEYKIVTPAYYRNLWMILGMTVFGVPFGLMISSILDNFAFFSLGMPIGMPVGMAIGIGLDRKAEQEGRVLDFGDTAKSFV